MMACSCWWKRLWMLTIWLLLLLLLLPRSHGCKDDCTCHSTVDSQKCLCVSNDFICAIANLSNGTTNLNFTLKVQDAKPIHLEQANLGRFHQLKELSIGVPYAEHEKVISSLFGLNNGNTFSGLGLLETLRLNVFLDSSAELNVSIFTPLSSLVELDLSYTMMMRFSQLRDAFQEMSTASLKRLRLRNVQSNANNPDFTIKLNLTSFLEPLERMPLELLDISRNALMRVDSGIFRHHNLKEIYFHENFIRVTSFYTEILLHPTIEISVGDFQGCPANAEYTPKFYHDWVDPLDNISVPLQEAQPPTKGNSQLQNDQLIGLPPKHVLERSTLGSESKVDNTGSIIMTALLPHKTVSSSKKFNQKDLGTSTLMSNGHPIGKHGRGYFICLLMKPLAPLWMDGISCEDFPDIDVVFAGPPCIFPVQIPLAPHLTEYHLADFSYYQGGFGSPVEGTYCFDPNNQLKLIDFSNIGEWGKMFSTNVNHISVTGLLKLEVVNLEGSELELYNPNFLANLPSLRVFNNRMNRLHLENDTEAMFFRKNTHLQELILSHNGLFIIASGEFSHLRKLQILDLSQNELTNVSFSLPTSGLLHSLKLNGNKIQTMTEKTRKQLDEIAGLNEYHLEVDLSDNQLSCGCGDAAFINWMQTTRVRFLSKETYQCRGPRTGSELITKIDLKKLDSLCNPSHLKVICASVLSTLGVVAVFVVAFSLHHKRHAIMHWRYTKFTRPGLPYDDNTTRYVYDGFITYNSDDKWWTHHPLLAEMEERRGLKLCIYLRDFPGGGAYADVIEEYMDKSRKTVLVLSPKFFESNWCQHEMNMAHNKLVADGLDLVELVILAPLSSREMNNTVTQLLQVKDPIVWTENPDGKELFWDKLEDALRSPRSYPNRV